MIAALPLLASAASSVLGSTSVTGVANAAKTATSASSVSSAGDSFSSMMASFSKDTVDKLKTSESMSVAGLQGKATTQSVVEAVIAAQESLQTAIAVRDKAVGAFQEVSRMAI